MQKRPLKRTKITIKEKIDIIKQHKEGSTNSDIAKRFNKANSTISTIIKNEDRIRKQATFLPNTKKLCRIIKPPFDELEKELFEFYKEIKNSNYPINGNILKAKAQEIANCRGEFLFESSQGWFQRFKKRLV